MRILTTLSALLFTLGLVYAQTALSDGDDYAKTGTKYVVVWAATHKVPGGRENPYGQLPLYEYAKDYSVAFDTKAEATAFITDYNCAKSSTGTLTVLGVPKIKIIATTEDK